MPTSTASATALITGASRGIGRAIARKLAGEGLDLWLTARTREDLKDLQTELRDRHPAAGIHIFPTDLSRREGVTALIEAVRRVDDAPQLLVNNLGWFATGGVLEEPEGRLEQMMAINLYPAYRLSRAFAPVMADRGRGHIFNIISVAAREGFADRGAYLISKHAQLGLSRALREELRNAGVRVTALLPGPTLTSSWQEDQLPDVPLIAPEDIARTLWAAYEVSEAAVVEEVVIRPQRKVL